LQHLYPHVLSFFYNGIIRYNFNTSIKPFFYMDFVLWFNPLNRNILLSKLFFNYRLVLSYKYQLLGVIEFVSYLPKTFAVYIAARLGMFEKYGILLFGFSQLIFYGISFIITFLYSKYKGSILMKSFKI
jgi:hypothetical protein